MLNHIGITINNEQEIADFYRDILDFEIVKKFRIDSNLSYQIFEIDSSTDVILMKRDDVYFEVFIIRNKTVKNYNHICLAFHNRYQIIKKAKEKAYRVKIFPRDTFDLVFIYDRCGNIFEVKELGLDEK